MFDYNIYLYNCFLWELILFAHFARLILYELMTESSFVYFVKIIL